MSDTWSNVPFSDASHGKYAAWVTWIRSSLSQPPDQVPPTKLHPQIVLRSDLLAMKPPISQPRFPSGHEDVSASIGQHAAVHHAADV